MDIKLDTGVLTSENLKEALSTLTDYLNSDYFYTPYVPIFASPTMMSDLKNFDRFSGYKKYKIYI